MGQDESIKLYLAEMAKIPLISKDEMDELLERMRNNDDEARKILFGQTAKSLDKH